jgi:hypothetical protein
MTWCLINYVFAFSVPFCVIIWKDYRNSALHIKNRTMDNIQKFSSCKVPFQQRTCCELLTLYAMAVCNVSSSCRRFQGLIYHRMSLILPQIGGRCPNCKHVCAGVYPAILNILKVFQVEMRSHWIQWKVIEWVGIFVRTHLVSFEAWVRSRYRTKQL